ncbi:acyltransferase [Vibrio ezurae]|uniref:Galactoside O-acetyltransferase n=1 Tax=Vibrio ezurae NBRC 102218 TaxID=1219080 RepID=U3B340_9VIBR|nr:acyltransferase [Vibrio ezurae]GAD80350.1 galactoside O-acetyltransferase [Vibrio ezurae NBRC 102218]
MKKPGFDFPSVQAVHGGPLSDEEFKKFTLYLNKSNNLHDDCARASILGFHNEKVRIAVGAIVRIGQNQIGEASYIGINSYINGDVTIGKNVLVGPHVSIVASNHLYSAEDDCFSARTDKKAGKVIIGDGVWLTSGVVITPGNDIGKCSLICANSVVTTDIPPYSIAAGTPAKVIGKIDSETGEYHWFKQEK